MGVVLWIAHVGALGAFLIGAYWSLLVWAVVVYLAVRVRLDAELLEMLAVDTAAVPARLDAWLESVGLRRSEGERTIAQRCRGARRLACYLVGACVLQWVVTAVVLLTRKPG